jgi:hypothetical protein
LTYSINPRPASTRAATSVTNRPSPNGATLAARVAMTAAGG